MRELQQRSDLALHRVGAAKTGDVCSANDGIMTHTIDVLGNVENIFLSGHPTSAIEAGKVDQTGIGAQNFSALRLGVLMEVRHHEFSDRFIDGIAVPQCSVIRFTDRAEMSAMLENRNHVIVIVIGDFEIEHERTLTYEPQRERGKHCTLHTVRCALSKHSPGGHARLAFQLKIDRKPIEEILNFRRRNELPEHPEFIRSQAKHVRGAYLHMTPGREASKNLPVFSVIEMRKSVDVFSFTVMGAALSEKENGTAIPTLS